MAPFQHPPLDLDLLEPDLVLGLESVFVLAAEVPLEVVGLVAVVEAVLDSASGWRLPQLGRPCSQTPALGWSTAYY